MVLAVIGSADESWSARSGRLRQAPSLALCCLWRRRFTLDDAGELIGPYLGNASDEAAKALPSFGKPATAIILYRRLQDARCVPAF